VNSIPILLAGLAGGILTSLQIWLRPYSDLFIVFLGVIEICVHSAAIDVIEICERERKRESQSQFFGSAAVAGAGELHGLCKRDSGGSTFLCMEVLQGLIFLEGMC
jgi:hypothetical protein